AVSPTPSVNSALQNQINEIAAEAKGKVGVSALVLNGENSGNALPDSRATAPLNPHEHFPMQSVYKVPISMAVMKGVDAGKIKLTDQVSISKNDLVGRAAQSPIRHKYPNGVSLTVDELLRYALSESDGTASDMLMKLAGGPAAVQAYLTELGIKDMIVLDTEQTFAQDRTAQFRNWATPEASVALLRALHERRGLSEPSQAVILKYMKEGPTGRKRLKGLLPAGTVVAHKTGTSHTVNGVTAATNDIGIITLPNGKHVAIAVFVSDSPADEATREGVIARIAKAVYDAVSGE
ncbi:MAG TPA: class A beta-lactamase, partial [Pyrinomonadaceae bacterium]|nr:class A beta-lactamase [Pyrinomonadaceae bacterium]